MFRAIDITRFGQFENFNWARVHARAKFEKLNIIYGRNYSGKTTLSRIFRSVEKDNVHPDYASTAAFNFITANGNIDSASLGSAQPLLLTRVYNSDFVRENLNWLHRVDGTIEPFAILGSVNAELQAELDSINAQLGDITTPETLLYRQAAALKAHQEFGATLKASRDSFNKKLTQQAAAIKNSTGDFALPVYTIEHLRRDIRVSTDEHIISQEEVDRKRLVLRQVPLLDLAPLPEFNPSLTIAIEEVKALVATPLEPTLAIQDLLANNILQEWVRHGIELHKDQRDTCGFCSNKLPETLWQKLESHFNKASDELRAKIEAKIATLNRSVEKISKFISIDPTKFYPDILIDVRAVEEEWYKQRDAYIESLSSLVSQLEIRKNNIFSPHQLPDTPDNSSEIIQAVRQLNALISSNNTRNGTLHHEQAATRRQLLLSHVAKFKNTTKYEQTLSMLTDSDTRLLQLQQEHEQLTGMVNHKLTRVTVIQRESSNEGRGANLVNSYLKGFFGCSQLTLAPVGEPALKYQIMRHTEIAHNLSEGECSLISFCYFMAKIEQELQDPTLASQLIIYIDDPVSSLDSNHVFFMFSLIEKVIAEPRNYAQFFISTHSVEFLKYLRRLSKPSEPHQSAYFVVESNMIANVRISQLIPMPAYMKDYQTEFNYLFKKIFNAHLHHVRDPSVSSALRHSDFFELPNTMRKFLECYLFYAFPNTKSPLDNLEKLFDGNVPIILNRIANEFSHLTQLERGWVALDPQEIETSATLLLTRLKQRDPQQFTALCEAVNVTDNIVI